MPQFIQALFIGVVAGLRAMMPLAAVSWAAHLGWLDLGDTPLAFLGNAWAPYVCTVLAIGELINDKLPKTPSRKVPASFAARVVTGAFGGAAIGAPVDTVVPCVVAGAIGAIAGTLGGYEFRRRLVQATGGKDLPIALLEDAIAIALGFWVVSR